MPSYLVQVGAQVLCSHAGQANPTSPNPRVTLNGQPTVLFTTPYAVAGCTMPPPPSGNGPCVTAQWTTGGSMRVQSGGQPLLLQTSQAICTPTGTPLQIVSTQARATAE